MMPADLTFVGLRPLGKLMVSDSGGESESHGKIYCRVMGERAPGIRQTVPSGTSRPYPSYISSSVTKCQSARSAIFSLVATLTSCLVNSIKLVAT